MAKLDEESTADGWSVKNLANGDFAIFHDTVYGFARGRPEKVRREHQEVERNETTPEEREMNTGYNHAWVDDMLAMPVRKELPSEIQVGGDHYRDMVIQPSEFIYKNDLNWLVGNAIKYLCRYSLKGGKQDLEKAKHYINLLIEWEYEKE